MLQISVVNKQQDEQLEHADGPLEFGRGPRQNANAPRRILIKDSYVSRDQLFIEEQVGGRLLMRNLSARRRIVFAMSEYEPLGPGDSRQVLLPLVLNIGETTVTLHADSGDQHDESSFASIAEPFHAGRTESGTSSLLKLGGAPPPERFAHWLETIIGLERNGGDLPNFYQNCAKALVELIGLDVGLVVLRKDEDWTLAAGHAIDDTAPMRFSRTLVNLIYKERRTYYQDLDQELAEAQSLSAIQSLVASPIFGLRDDVAGVLYGARTRVIRGQIGVTALEAQVVQLLATVIGANLARSTAVRTRVQFEQFFSPELVGQLERDPRLLESREQNVSILCSDLRGFTALSEQLGAETTCRLIRDLMEHLTEQVARQGGVIVDYAGDGILAMWNAPAPQPDHAHRACRAALRMQAEMGGINNRWRDTVGAQLRLGVGVNTGPAQVGNIGSKRKFKYGPHGHTVNLASRVQGATKDLDCSVLVTSSTMERVVDSFQLRPMGAADLQGVQERTPLYELMAEAETLGE